jgi:hypothetical protein
VWSDYNKLYVDPDFSGVHKVNKEDDFFELHVAQITLENANYPYEYWNALFYNFWGLKN